MLKNLVYLKIIHLIYTNRNKWRIWIRYKFYWINELNLLKSNKDGPTPKIIMIIGNKTLVNQRFVNHQNELLLTNPNRPVSYLEIDLVNQNIQLLMPYHYQKLFKLNLV